MHPEDTDVHRFSLEEHRRGGTTGEVTPILVRKEVIVPCLSSFISTSIRKSLGSRTRFCRKTTPVKLFIFRPSSLPLATLMTMWSLEYAGDGPIRKIWAGMMMLVWKLSW
ncbi:hypothetical protein EYF80_059869 [Liparis tanakae]|uniref:Uncharacterized protein n=1 Tax=Liparis tanakae TaxID=230148 RepID=A0A4Z2EN35_9TELE|nr:hypothetical protein EYF80_059869 [Liparis tanakae]